MTATDPPPQLYAKRLLPFGYGYPLWTPEPSNEILQHRRDGLRIGDVGVIDLKNGSFDLLFNICLPHDHPLHRATGVPDNFLPIDLDEWDITSFPHAESPGRVISTSSVMATSVTPSSLPTFRPSTYEFSLSSNEGALLILPKGAESYKLRRRQLFKDVATRNAVHWYNFSEKRLGRIIAYDSLYLITGLHKTSSWSVAAFHQSTGSAESSAQFQASQVGEGNHVSYTWDTMRALDWRAGPQLDVGIPNQCVFVNGFKIAIREGMLGKNEVETLHPQSLSAKISNGSDPSSSRLANIWRRLMSRGGTRGATNPSEKTRRPKGPRTTFSWTRQVDKAANGHVAINHVPQSVQGFHPSDIVNRYLLRTDPSASVAITHDSQWSILFEKGALKPGELDHDGQLEKIVSESYRIISQDGTACLQCICDSSVRPTDMDDATRVAWQEDRLDDVEEILSRQLIGRTIGSDHSAFANRALIRARLRHWDAALRDAEMSINIQPSVIAHVAKGFALFRQGKYEIAVAAFNIALRQCDTRDRDIVLLIKSIVLFEAGYHAESMAGIADLNERCPIDAKSACSFVQAEMYVRLATLATKNEGYDRALQLLTRAQSLSRGPSHAFSDLNVISMICGWKFDNDNLQFSIHQQRCEVLHAAGRTDEVVDSFQKMVSDLGEGVRVRKDIVAWIASFTRQFSRSLEILGDDAMESKNYTEAIAHFSVALSIDPPNREIILVKQSKAYTAARVLADTSKDADRAINLSPSSPTSFERKHEALQGMGRYDETVRAFNEMHSILQQSASAQMQHPFQNDSLQSMTATQTMVPHMSTLSNPPARRSRSPTVEPIAKALLPMDQRILDIPDTIRSEREAIFPAQDLSAKDLERQHKVQLAEVVTQITAIRELLGSNVTTVELGHLLHHQMTNVLNTILQFQRDQGVTAASPKDDQIQATGITSAPVHVSDRRIGVCIIQPPVPIQEPIDPASSPEYVQVDRYSPINASLEALRPIPSPIAVDVSSYETGGSYRQDDPWSTDNMVDRNPLRKSAYHDDDRGYLFYSPDVYRRYRDMSEDDDSVNRSGYRQRVERCRSRTRERQYRLRRRRSCATSDDIADDNPSPSVQRPTQTFRMHGTEGSNTAPLDFGSDLGNLISTWQDILGGMESRDDSYHQRGQTLRSDCSRRSAGGHRRIPRNFHQAHSRHQPCNVGTAAPSHAAMNVHVQQPGISVQPPTHPMMPPGPSSQMLAQPPAPLYDTLLEILREQRLAHCTSMDQQQELMKQMRGLSECLMREMQDRLSELRNMTGGRSAELGQPHHGVGVAPPVIPIPGLPWTAPWHQPLPVSFNATSYATTPFGGTPFNAYNSAPFIPAAPSPPHHPPFIPPEPILREIGPPTIPRQIPGVSQENDTPAPGPSLVSSDHPGKTSVPMIIQPPASKFDSDSQSTSSQVQTMSNATSAPKSLLLGSECGSSTVVGTVVQSPTSGPSPFSALSTQLRVPECGSPTLSTMGIEGMTAKSADKQRRHGMVTFGDVTFI